VPYFESRLAPLRETLNPDNENFLALSVYLRSLNDIATTTDDVDNLRATLNSIF
jgi:hypothetical protein